MKTQTFTANEVRTRVFRVHRSSRVDFDIAITGTGTATLTVVRDGLAAHDVKPAADPTDPLTGASFSVSASLTTSLYLGEGDYGITITSASGLTCYYHVDGRQVSVSKNTVL